MKKGIKLLAATVMGMAVVACSSAEKMAEQRVEVMHGKKQLPDREKAAPLRDLS